VILNRAGPRGRLHPGGAPGAPTASPPALPASLGAAGRIKGRSTRRVTATSSLHRRGSTASPAGCSDWVSWR